MKRIILLVLSLLLVLVFTTMAFATDYKEAPELKAKVEQGNLSSVAERLPETPLVVKEGTLLRKNQIDLKIGQYGGTLQLVHTSPGWSAQIFLMSTEPLVEGPGTSTANIRGNVVKDFKVNNDNTEFTFYMRKGLKWSDGVPVTTDDVKFTYEDVLMNKDITPVLPLKYRTGGKSTGKPMNLKIIDKYTFKISFDKPYGSFLIQLSTEGWPGYSDLIKPKHYLKKFHPKYTSMEKIKPYLEEEELGENEWSQLFNLKDVTNWDLTSEDAIGFPVLYPWIRVKSDSGIRMERNPYYFKVDAEGQQLPYISKIRSLNVSNQEMANMKVITGDVDFFTNASLNKMPLYLQNAEKGNYKVYESKDRGTRTFFLNLTYNDPTWKKVVGDTRFRQALNYSINRDEVENTIYYDRVPPLDSLPSKYDPNKAKEILDQMGMVNQDDDKWREAPNGDDFSIILEVTEDRLDFVPIAELLTSYFKAIDINTTMKQISSELWQERRDSNNLMATVFYTNPLTGWRNNPTTDYVPQYSWAPQWVHWNETNGKAGEKPADWAKRLFEIKSKRLTLIPNSPEDKKLATEIFDIYRSKLPVFVIVNEFVNPIVGSNRLKNLPDTGNIHEYQLPGEQFFIQD